MDIASYLQRFENSLTSYTGDDPLDAWIKFVEYLEQRLPTDGGRGMLLVFERLIQRFLNVEQYANDIRYVNYCIKCASYYVDPVSLYSQVFSRGVGTRTAGLYVAWAQHFEQRGLHEQADAVYQKALENQAHPASTVLHEYKQFQTRTRSETAVSGGSRNPLQNSNLTNQVPHREPVTQNKMSVDCPSKFIDIVSRSETSGTIPTSQGSGIQTVSEYTVEDLVCDESELCFEEARAQNYFRKLPEQEEKDETDFTLTPSEGEERNKWLLEKVFCDLEIRQTSSQKVRQKHPDAIGCAECASEP
uniref:mitotic checkpoint serine/threonine-protein kinase BUB1 n=1 Tax=Maylandia zebra TaxID=106582 RepID=UPI000D31F77A|nr:mitotic checkpoint serine/threonine-protein kinase BUB1 [Maylandia zebra]